MGAGFKLARRRLRANPSKASCESKGEGDGEFCEKVRVKTLGQLGVSFILWAKRASSLAHQIWGCPFLLKVTKRIGPYIK